MFLVDAQLLQSKLCRREFAVTFTTAVINDLIIWKTFCLGYIIKSQQQIAFPLMLAAHCFLFKNMFMENSSIHPGSVWWMIVFLTHLLCTACWPYIYKHLCHKRLKPDLHKTKQKKCWPILICPCLLSTKNQSSGYCLEKLCTWSKLLTSKSVFK